MPPIVFPPPTDACLSVQGSFGALLALLTPFSVLLCAENVAGVDANEPLPFLSLSVFRSIQRRSTQGMRVRVVCPLIASRHAPLRTFLTCTNCFVTNACPVVGLVPFVHLSGAL